MIRGHRESHIWISFDKFDDSFDIWSDNVIRKKDVFDSRVGQPREIVRRLSRAVAAR